MPLNAQRTVGREIVPTSIFGSSSSHMEGGGPGKWGTWCTVVHGNCRHAGHCGAHRNGDGSVPQAIDNELPLVFMATCASRSHLVRVRIFLSCSSVRVPPAAILVFSSAASSSVQGTRSTVELTLHELNFQRYRMHFPGIFELLQYL